MTPCRCVENLMNMKNEGVELDMNGIAKADEYDAFVELGQAVITHFINSLYATNALN